MFSSLAPILWKKHIGKARAGEYPDKKLKRVSEERIKRFFDRTPDGLRVTKYVREMCVFASQDVIQDPPFPNIDLVSCRNVLIYFSEAFQETAIPLFHFSLKENGCLMLGTSETMGRFPSLFTSLDSKANIYTKRNTGTKPIYRFPVSTPMSKAKTGPERPTTRTKSSREYQEVLTTRVKDLLLDTFAPPSVLIDSGMQIRQFHGHTSPYIDPAVLP